MDKILLDKLIEYLELRIEVRNMCLKQRWELAAFNRDIQREIEIEIYNLITKSDLGFTLAIEDQRNNKFQFLKEYFKSKFETDDFDKVLILLKRYKKLYNLGI